MTWIILIGLVVIYWSFGDKIERLIKLVKKQNRQKQEEKGMSKVIQGLVNKKCLINTDEALTLVGKAEIEGIILETDEEWIKLEYLDKNNEKTISVFRIDSVDYISVIE